MTTNAAERRTPRQCSSIADQYGDLLAPLDEGRRQGMIRRLAVGFYEGWLPSRAELSTLVDFELGRISEAEFFATKLPPRPPSQAPDRSATGGRSGVDPRGFIGGRQLPALPAAVARLGPGKPGKPAVFNVDCGELAGNFRFVAKRLRAVGWSVRDDENYRLVFLEYELRPPVTADQSADAGLPPVAFDAAILFVPDVPAPWSAEDGRRIRHVVGPQAISGSRGPWAVARQVRRIKFLISRQVAPGTRPKNDPAGVLVIDIAQGAAAWRPAAARQMAKVASN